MTDDLTLVVGGRQISGWTSVRVTRGIERCPSDFEVEMTELYPDEASAFVIQPGDTCRVLLGSDPVITGYVDRFAPAMDAGGHSIHVSGRGKCADLVDCAAEWSGGQISGSSVLEIARKLVEPYGVASAGGSNSLQADIAAQQAKVDAAQSAVTANLTVVQSNTAQINAYSSQLGAARQAGDTAAADAIRSKAYALVDNNNQRIADDAQRLQPALDAEKAKLKVLQSLAVVNEPPSGIKVRADVADVGPVIPQFSLTLGTTAFEIIEQLCRYSALLAYDEPDGNLLLTRASTKQAASGFRQGVNVQSASLTFSIDQRYSEVLGFIQSVDMFKDAGEGGNLIATIMDPNVPRHRRKIIVAEYGDSNFEVLKKRAAWEVSRRSGRSRALQLTTDSWRDAAGTLWTPNTLVDLELPALKLPQAKWLISEVTFRRDGSNGTAADLVIMPPEAFDVQPIVFLPAPADVQPMAGK